MPIKTQTRSCEGAPGCDTASYKGSALAVYNKGSDCTSRLRRQRSIKSPSIPIQLTDEITELRDGSVAFPIKLPALQKYTGNAIPALVGMLADGTLVQWNFAYFNGRKKFILEDGQMKMAGDYASDLLDQPICEASCLEVGGALGYKTIIETCAGQPDKTVYQICRIPTCCCDDTGFELCVSCNDLNAIVVPPVI